MEIKGGWLTNFEDNYFAPCTLFSQVKNDNNTNGGTLLDTTFQVNLSAQTAATINAQNRAEMGVTGILPIANGGTGASTLSANKLLYIKDSKFTASKHYIDNDKIQINVDSSVEDYNFYVNGNSLFNGQVDIKGDLSIKNNGYSSHILFSPQSLNTLAGKINYNTRQEFTPGEISNISRFEFNQYSHDSYNENTLLETYDCYFLPSTPNDKGTNDYYEIITSKGGSSINGNMIFNGQTTFNGYTFFTSRFVINNSENGSTLRFGSSKTSNNEADLRARIRYMFKKSASDSLVNRSQFIFEQNSYNSTTGAKLSYMDTFRLPETAANKTGNNTYDIITSKGGTISGNLTLTSTLDLSGATVTGPIRIKSNTDAALSKLGSIAIGPDNGQQIRIDNNEIISVNYDSGTSAYVSSTLYLNTEGEGKVQIGSIDSALVPSTTKEYNLGASATRWMNSYVSGYCYCGALVVGKSGAEDTAATGYGTGSVSALTAIVGRVYFKVLS